MRPRVLVQSKSRRADLKWASWLVCKSTLQGAERIRLHEDFVFEGALPPHTVVERLIPECG